MNARSQIATNAGCCERSRRYRPGRDYRKTILKPCVKKHSLDALNGENKTERQDGLVILVIVVAHVVLLFRAESFICHSIWSELFVLGYVLVIADSGLLVFLGIKLFGPVLSGNKTK